jgi:hypothetical protein
LTQFGPVRLTLDEYLRAGRSAGVEFNSSTGSPVLPRHTIVEMKFTVTMPVMFKLLVEEFALNPIRFSKYRFAANALGLAKGDVVSEELSALPCYA